MKKLIVLLAGLFVITGYNIAQVSVYHGYHGGQMERAFASGSFSNSAQSGQIGNVDPYMSEHIANPKEIYSTYNPISVYSSTLSKPFDSESYEDTHVIKRSPPGGGGSGVGVQDPLGDAVAPMLLMLVGYALWRRRRRLQNP